jgi:tetratricopeptide (TPR) repeat protein
MESRKRVGPSPRPSPLSTEEREKEDARPAPRWKWFLFRLFAILLGLSPLLFAEAVLRFAGLGKPTDGNDPFVGFSEIHPLFVLNESTGRYEIAKSRLTHFRPASFAAKKGPREFRIFVLGGSTVQGRPWSTETSFTSWLELNLNAASDQRQFTVINCGGVSYSSYRLVPILREVLHYQPDLVIFYEGNNEFLEDRSYAPIKNQSAAVAWAERQAMQLRTYNLLRAGVLSLQSSERPEREILGPEVDARLDWKGGLADYHHDEQWRRDVITHFDFNLRRLAAIAREAQVPLLLVNPVANLEWEPFKSEHRADLSPRELKQFDEQLEQARALYATDLSSAVNMLQSAMQLDPQYAAVHYELGMSLLELGRRNEAEQALRRAKELDVCPLRILEPMRSVVQQVAADNSTPVVDAEEVIVARSRNGFADRQWMVDHVHPTIEGHQLLADALAVKLVELKYLQPETDWQTAKERAYREHLAGLSPVYFERAQQRLKSEQGWARGQVKKQRPANNTATKP